MASMSEIVTPARMLMRSFPRTAARMLASPKHSFNSEGWQPSTMISAVRRTLAESRPWWMSTGVEKGSRAVASRDADAWVRTHAMTLDGIASLGDASCCLNLF
jgi:hypothetical protein